MINKYNCQNRSPKCYDSLNQIWIKDCEDCEDYNDGVRVTGALPYFGIKKFLKDFVKRYKSIIFVM